MFDTNDIKLKPGQQQVLKQLQSFVEDKDHKVFILKGYAGTGKTTLMRFLIQYLTKIDRKYLLLASTGRASKILSNITHEPSQTVHSLIYQFEKLNLDLSDVQEEPDGQLFLSFVATKVDKDDIHDCIYIVDESSMISNFKDPEIIQAKFGSGKLLTDLFDHDSRSNSKFIFIGDPCQLAPINSLFSPALSKEYVESEFNIKAVEAQLTEIIRQDSGNSIIKTSQIIRNKWKNAPSTKNFYLPRMKVWGKLPFRNCKDIVLFQNSGEMLEEYYERIKDGNYNNTTYISYSNGSCLDKALLIRNRLGFQPDTINKGDLLMVVQNNYLSSLMNGDMVEVVEVSSHSERVAELNFRRITVRELFTRNEYSLLLLENLLFQKSLNLTSYQQKSLFWDFNKRMRKEGITQKNNKDYYNAMMMKDPYLNALRCSFGYVITCHKAQGGEWDEVFLDMPRSITLNPTKNMYQWVYTAMTRAKVRLNLVDDFYLE